MIKGIFLYVIGIVFVAWGIHALATGYASASDIYNSLGGTVSSGIVATILPAVLAALRFACAYGCYIYGKQRIQEYEEEKNGYSGPSFKDIGKSTKKVITPGHLE